MRGKRLHHATVRSGALTKELPQPAPVKIVIPSSRKWSRTGTNLDWQASSLPHGHALHVGTGERSIGWRV